MDIEKLKAEFEQSECFKRLEHVAQYTFFEFGAYIKRTDVPTDIEKKCGKLITALLFSWSAWKEAKAQVVPKWISVKDKLPSDDIGRVLAWVVEQNSLGKCGFVWNCSHSNGVFSDKFETFQVTHWMPLPDAPQEPTND